MKKLLSSILCLLAALLLCGAAAQPAPAEASAPALDGYVFQAGKADAILLTTENAAVLIDTGEKGFGKEIAARCAEQGIEKLDYLILTHFDRDHVGGAARVLRELPVGCVLQSCYPKKSVEYTHYLKALRRAGLEPVTVRGELSFTLDGVVFTVNAPRLERYADSPSNNSSLIVTVECGDCRLLFLGDAENARLSEWLESDPAPCAFVKLPHHGAWHSALVRLMEELRPGCALITSSEEEPESPKTRELLDRLAVETFCTREAPVLLRCGADGLVLRYDGE